MNHSLKEKARYLEPVLRIGKKGITEETLKEITRQLKKKKLVKIKFLRSFLENNDRKEAAKIIAEKTDSKIIDQVGFVVVLGKR